MTSEDGGAGCLQRRVLYRWRSGGAAGRHTKRPTNDAGGKTNTRECSRRSMEEKTTVDGGSCDGFPRFPLSS